MHSRSGLMPILVGGGQVTNRLPPNAAPTPLQMMLDSAELAAKNAGSDRNLLAKIDTIAATRLALDSTDFGNFGVGRYANLPKSVANHLGATLRAGFYAAAGGNTPQMLVNEMAERIANGESEVVLLTGSENLNTFVNAMKSGVKLDWNDEPGGEPTYLGENKPGSSEHENLYGFFYPINTYPLFENAIRAHRGESLNVHMEKISALYSKFSAVAAENPLAWFPTFRSKEEIMTVDDKNRYIGYPYTKYLNAVIHVDQAASILMMSVNKAKELGIPEDRWVYLNGCADATDHWYVSERINYYSSPAIQRAAQETFKMAKTELASINYFDIYSCFPSAVEIACSEIGLAEDDARGLTITGGLPYFGGPGNNYVMHSISTMLDKVRSKPGSNALITANGWHITKHSMGIYSTKNMHEKWQRTAPTLYQAELDAMPKTPVTEVANGVAIIETYTVTHTSRGPQDGIVIGKLADGTRFIANTPNDTALLEKMKTLECVGLAGEVVHQDGRNIFTPTF